MNYKERITLINRIAKWVFDHTESFEYRNIGSDLAYLVWAIADDGDPWLDKHDSKDRELVYILKGNPNDLWKTLVEEGLVVEEPTTKIEIHVLGGVAHPPDKLPPGIELEIIDHDNERR